MYREAVGSIILNSIDNTRCDVLVEQTVEGYAIKLEMPDGEIADTYESADTLEEAKALAVVMYRGLLWDLKLY